MSTVASVKESLASLEKHRKAASQELSKLGEQRSALQKERDGLRKQGLSREDYAELVLADIDRVADLSRKKLQASMLARARGDGNQAWTSATYGNAIDAVARNANFDPAYSIEHRIFADPLQCGIHAFLKVSDGLPMEIALHLFRDTIKAETKAAILAIENWPHAPVMTMEQIRKRLTEIDTEVAALDASINEIRAALAQFNCGENR